jgi:hypothetical protein
MSPIGPNAKCRLRRAMSGAEGEAENICSYWVLLSLTRLRHAGCIEQCPSSRPNRKCMLALSSSQFDSTKQEAP